MGGQMPRGLLATVLDCGISEEDRGLQVSMRMVRIGKWGLPFFVLLWDSLSQFQGRKRVWCSNGQDSEKGDRRILLVACRSGRDCCTKRKKKLEVWKCVSGMISSRQEVKKKGI